MDILLANVTPNDIPSGFFLLAIGFAAGFLANRVWSRFQA